MANSIRHQGVVENVTDTHLLVRIVQTSACASCSIKGHCTSADAKEKLIEVAAPAVGAYRVGQQVWVVGELSMGVRAVLLAFVAPFLLLVVSLFLFMHLWQNEVASALGALSLLIPYYLLLYLNKSRMKRRFAFSVRPVDDR